MQFEQRARLDAPIETVWSHLMDLPAVARSVPGVDEFIMDDPETYRGVLRTKVGPISVRLQGRIRVVERDAATYRSRIHIEAAEKRLASTVTAETTMQLQPVDAATTDLIVVTNASVLGKLGEFGQAIMRRRADQIVGEFASNLGAVLSGAPTSG